jgi:hypothetical protein
MEAELYSKIESQRDKNESRVQELNSMIKRLTESILKLDG